MFYRSFSISDSTLETERNKKSNVFNKSLLDYWSDVYIIIISLWSMSIFLSKEWEIEVLAWNDFEKSGIRSIVNLLFPFGPWRRHEPSKLDDSVRACKVVGIVLNVVAIWLIWLMMMITESFRENNKKWFLFKIRPCSPFKIRNICWNVYHHHLPWLCEFIFTFSGCPLMIFKRNLQQFIFCIVNSLFCANFNILALGTSRLICLRLSVVNDYFTTHFLFEIHTWTIRYKTSWTTSIIVTLRL